MKVTFPVVWHSNFPGNKAPLPNSSDVALSAFNSRASRGWKGVCMFIEPLCLSKNRFGVEEETVLKDEYVVDGSAAAPRELREEMPEEAPFTSISGIFVRVGNGA